MATEEQGKKAKEGAAYWQEFMATLLLSLAAVGSAYGAWQASLWGGVQAIQFAEASSVRIESSRAASEGIQQLAYDASTFVQYVLAVAVEGRDREAVREVANRFMRKEFRPYVDEWLALKPFQNPEAPDSPFELPDFKNASREESFRLERLAREKLEAGKEANHNADEYVLATLYFALVLFFAGVSSKLLNRRLITVALMLGATGVVLGVVQVLSLPFQPP